MLKLLKQFLFYKTSIGENRKTVQAEVMEENRKSAIIWATVQILYWAYCLIKSTNAEDFMKCRTIYFVALTLCAVALVLAFVARKVKILVRPDNMEERLKKMAETGSHWKGEYIDEITISCGFSSSNECNDFESMLKTADQRMYLAKKEYYETSGNNRRQE